MDSREAPCRHCGSDWHYTDEHVPEPDVAAGTALASALMAANYPGDSGEDVDRLIRELRKRGYTLAALAAAPEPLSPHPDEPHEFRTVCRRCGEYGYLNVAVITDYEVVKIVPRAALLEDKSDPTAGGKNE